METVTFWTPCDVMIAVFSLINNSLPRIEKRIRKILSQHLGLKLAREVPMEIKDIERS
jgi:hypothetical protein